MSGVQILLIVGIGNAVSSLARRRGVEPGLIIVVLAAAASFIPGVPRLELESELILAIVVRRCSTRRPAVLRSPASALTSAPSSVSVWSWWWRPPVRSGC